ncbi:MAG: extracellular solute-binding protein, partial [Caldilineae bacterium]
LDLHPLHKAIFSPPTPDAWDVAFLSSDWFAQAHAEGTVADLSPWLAANPPAGYPDGWTRSLLDLHNFDGFVLGLPYHDGPECLIYRTDLFADPTNQARFAEQHGRPLALPRTWEEFHQVARFFQRPEEGLYGTVFAAYPDGHNTVYDFCLQLWTRGGELFDSNGAIQVNTPEAAAALSFYRNVLNDRGAVHPDCRDMDSVKSGLAFATGQVAMMINWFGFAGMAETVDESTVKGKVDVAAIPSSPGASPVSLNAYWILCINRQSRHQDVAYQFLRHCASPAMDKLLTLTGGIGCRKSTWEDPEVNAEIPFYHKMADLHEYARALPRRRDWSEIAAEIDRLVLAVINTDEPIEKLLEEAQGRLG